KEHTALYCLTAAVAVRDGTGRSFYRAEGPGLSAVQTIKFRTSLFYNKEAPLYPRGGKFYILSLREVRR
ncbi:MAG TPA: hypothetical protein PK523_09765, partial [Elusimicrobiales bacterium]|nr:hypothetical protein [Elusimicrobiales bacterium]